MAITTIQRYVPGRTDRGANTNLIHYFPHLSDAPLSQAAGAGNFGLLIIPYTASTRALASVRDAQGSTWVVHPTQAHVPGTSRRCAVATCNSLNAGDLYPIEVQFDGNNTNNGECQFHEFSGVDPSTIQVVKIENADLTTHDFPVLTPSIAGSMVVVGYAHDTTTLVEDTDYTIQNQVGNTRAGYRTVVKPDATGEIVTLSTTGAANVAGIAIMIEPTGGAPTGPTEDSVTSPPSQLFGYVGTYDLQQHWTTSGGAVTFGNLQGAPAGITIVGDDLSYDGTTPVGTHSGITYDATDSNGTTTSTAFSLTIGAEAPTQGSNTTPNLTFAATTVGVLYNVASEWSLGAGGTAPITFAAVTLPAGITITSDGDIVSDGTTAINTYPNNQYEADDAANNGPTGSNLFTITVTSPAGTITIPPIQDAAETPITGKTGQVVAFFESATGAFLTEVGGLAQETDGSIIVTSSELSVGTDYFWIWIDPGADKICGSGHTQAT